MYQRVKYIPLFLLLLTGVGSRHTTAQNGDVAVVVSARNPIANLRASELRQIFAGEKHTWSSGVVIRIFVRNPGTSERNALLALLGMTEKDYGRYWAAQVFRGEAQSMPTALPSNGMQREAVLLFPGAVALVNMEELKPGMKVVKVDGRIPGQLGYALH